MSKYLWIFFVQIIYFLFITYSDLLFLKNYLQTVSNNSFKIYIDGETPSSVTNNAEMKRFLETFNTSKNPLVGSTTMSPNKGKKS